MSMVRPVTVFGCEYFHIETLFQSQIYLWASVIFDSLAENDETVVLYQTRCIWVDVCVSNDVTYSIN